MEKKIYSYIYLYRDIVYCCYYYIILWNSLPITDKSNVFVWYIFFCFYNSNISKSQMQNHHLIRSIVNKSNNQELLLWEDQIIFILR